MQQNSTPKNSSLANENNLNSNSRNLEDTPNIFHKNHANQYYDEIVQESGGRVGGTSGKRNEYNYRQILQQKKLDEEILKSKRIEEEKQKQKLFEEEKLNKQSRLHNVNQQFGGNGSGVGQLNGVGGGDRGGKGNISGFEEKENQKQLKIRPGSGPGGRVAVAQHPKMAIDIFSSNEQVKKIRNVASGAQMRIANPKNSQQCNLRNNSAEKTPMGVMEIELQGSNGNAGKLSIRGSNSNSKKKIQNIMGNNSNLHSDQNAAMGGFDQSD